MLINANSNTLKTKVLIEEYLKLIQSGIEAEKILVLVQNSKKKKEFIDEVKKISPEGNIGCLKIFSFYGLARDFILENWALVENSIPDEANIKIIPSLSGLEITQKIIKDAIEEVDFSGYNSKTSLLHQLFRRISLINLNNLTKDEIEKRSRILKEGFSREVNSLINIYKAKTISLRAFDYIRQLNVFEFLYKKVKNNFEYVFLDDGDEITPCVLAYLEYIKPDVKEFFISYDPMGSSRLGYLGAINVDFEKFLDKKATRLKRLNLKIEEEAVNIFNSVKNKELINIKSIKTKSFLKRNEMTECVLEDIKKLILSGVKPYEISIVTPNCDNFLKSEFSKSGFNFNFISKNEKLNENKLISYILELLKIINDTKNTPVSPYVLKGIFIELLKIDKKEALKTIREYIYQSEFKNISIFEILEKKENEKFQKLVEIHNSMRFKPLSEQIYKIAEEFIVFEKDIKKDIVKLNEILKQISDYENVFGDKASNNDLIIQLENTIISENPLRDEEIDENSIVVASAQKIIDYSYKTKYQFLLDVSSENWLKQDIGPLYNAWVMQKSWSKDSFELEDNIELTEDRTARTLYKLHLLSENTVLYSSVYDYLGAENFSGIDKYYKYNIELDKKTEVKPIIPRPDQKEVLEYKGGLMSVSATAGSGKTTIMLLLTEKLLSGEILKNIEPKNIFILTFMESAARNFKERIKTKYPDLKELPNISTIHGLALRILKENNNYSLAGLDYDFEILDEIKRNAILTEAIYANGVSSDKLDLYDRAISAYKNEIALYNGWQTSNILFLKIYNTYQEEIKRQNLIDYDDLLLLSLKILKENNDVLAYYQDLAKIIIEDEAQDSSYVQQELIRLLSGKHKNVIRCGDINQAITSTFTNSDVTGFRDFIKNSKNVVMDRCQRCATGVLTCANNTVKYAKEHNIEAFSDLIMKPVENRNIVDKNAVLKTIYDSEEEEKAFVINKIKEILKNDTNATIGVLLRSNFAINKWAKILEEQSIKTYKNSDALINNPVYKICLLILEYIANPYEINILKTIAEELYKLGCYDFETYTYAKNLKEPIFMTDDFDEQFWWDMNYFLFKNTYSLYELVVEIGQYYFSSSKNASNIPMVGAIAQKIANTSKTFENTVQKLREIQYRNNFSNIKFFLNDNDDKKVSSVQIMTLHKSKGDEFDYVFIPELTQDNLCLNVNDYKLKESSTFIQKVKKNKKSDLELKKEIIEENYRLIYVGITRAKKKLYLSSARSYKTFNKKRDYKISEFLEEII